jgi:hypothetical protein
MRGRHTATKTRIFLWICLQINEYGSESFPLWDGWGSADLKLGRNSISKSFRMQVNLRRILPDYLLFMVQ